MVNSVIIILAVVLLTGLLYFEKTGNRKAVIPTKTILSLFFVITVIVQSHPVLSYYHLLLAGLILCLIGDFFLALPQKAMFLAGLISFLLGHVLYVLAFFFVASISGLIIWPGVAVVLIVSGSVFLWLRPHLGGMKVPVFFYVVIISLMVIGAWSILIDCSLTMESRIVIFAGALLFYVSDIFVARDRFLKKEFLNRLIGLPLYYAGQFLLAFSVGLIG
jgi:uncharacterized membrane protein YhhN